MEDFQIEIGTFPAPPRSVPQFGSDTSTIVTNAKFRLKAAKIVKCFRRTTADLAMLRPGGTGRGWRKPVWPVQR
jgi:hypothetical protein